MWIFQLLIFLNGMETIRKFIDFCGPVVYLVMFALAIWIHRANGPVEPESATQPASSRIIARPIWPMQQC